MRVACININSSVCLSLPQIAKTPTEFVNPAGILFSFTLSYFMTNLKNLRSESERRITLYIPLAQLSV